MLCLKFSWLGGDYAFNRRRVWRCFQPPGRNTLPNYFLRFRRRNAAPAKSPEPKSIMVAGSGVGLIRISTLLGVREVPTWLVLFATTTVMIDANGERPCGVPSALTTAVGRLVQSTSIYTAVYVPLVAAVNPLMVPDRVFVPSLMVIEFNCPTLLVSKYRVNARLAEYSPVVLNTWVSLVQ